MKNIKNTLMSVASDTKELCTKAYFKALAGAATVMSTLAAAMPVGASAADGLFDKVSQKSSTGDAGTTVLGTILSIFQFAALILGVIMLLIGIIQFATAFRNEDAEGKTKASHVLIAGIILTVVGGVMATLVKGALGL